jgi:redox-sensitive bicupin YhaK (pirin superfamily)
MTSRTVVQVIQGYATSDGAGVKLTRVLDPRMATALDPFLLFDEFGSAEASDYVAGFPPHPHRGFETVTYMLVGRMRHKDNQGNQGDLGPGGVQWMSAARGIVHEEMPQQASGLMRGFQLWVNLPGAMKMADPWYDDIQSDRIPVVALPGGGTVKVISGEWGGAKGPVRNRPSEPIYLDVELPPGASFECAVPDGHTAMVHAVDGQVLVGPPSGGERQPLDAQQLALLSREGAVEIATGAVPGRALVIAGKPFREPIVHYGPFVMNSEREIRQALDDFRSGRF